MFKWIKSIDRTTVIKNSFLIPILAVVVMSISHVISWYELGNPISWAIYLSVAVEIFALASVSAASINIKKGSIWALFILVTLIQIIGNIYFTFKEIVIDSEEFISWIELISPIFPEWDSLDHRRFLSYIQGGTLPFMSLIALHFYIVFNEKKFKKENIQEKDLEVDKVDIEETEDKKSVIESYEIDSDVNPTATETHESSPIKEDENADQEELESPKLINDTNKNTQQNKSSSNEQWTGRHPRTMPGLNN